MIIINKFSIFDLIYKPYKITKPIRLIELFAGIGSQAKALKRLGVPFQHWKICEWAIPSILAYKEIHFKDKEDYSINLSKKELEEFLFKKGISRDYNNPLTKEQIARIPEQTLRYIYIYPLLKKII